jgi:hypothetical protein
MVTWLEVEPPPPPPFEAGKVMVKVTEADPAVRVMAQLAFGQVAPAAIETVV